MPTATEHLYITSSDQILSGEPIVRGTRTPVRAIVELWRQGSGPEEVCRHLPHLTLAQVFDALSYYSDHKDEINAYIELNSGDINEEGVTDRPTVLIVEDDEQTRSLLKDLLTPENDCTTVGSAEDALAILKTMSFSLVITDMSLGSISGLDLLPRVLEQSPDTAVVMISGQQTVDYAIEAMRAGAFDYITKPLNLRHVQTAARHALSHHELLTQKRRYENHLEDLVKERTAEIERLAYHDRLTSLPNRKMFADRCAQALASAQRSKEIVGVLLLAFDRFKKINDTLGHDAGDVVLTEAAVRLQSCVTLGDTVARFDGDEFALLLTHVVEASELAAVAREISQVFKTPFHVDGQELYVTTSIGISLFPFDGEDSRTILRNASAALHRAKRQGGNNYQFYTADMNDLALKRLALETSMRRAIENHEFITYYQPMVNLTSGALVGFEALVRWQHPELGLLPPGKFLGLAEDTGLILDIGDFVMRTACTQIRSWQDRGPGRLRLSVNVSSREFQQKDFVERLVRILGETKFDPTCLELDLMETSIPEDTEFAVKVLTQIRDLGVTIAIDDFGTGYSSLSYLKRLPIDTVKLDRAFVQGATTNPDDAALVMAIVTLAHNLRLRVIAEGVETDEQVAFLRLLRCDEAQGYLFGRPAASEVFESTRWADPNRKLDVPDFGQGDLRLPSVADKHRA
jgi:diguanylate cyclase (GGDEF)-like protein